MAVFLQKKPPFHYWSFGLHCVKTYHPIRSFDALFFYEKSDFFPIRHVAHPSQRHTLILCVLFYYRSVCERYCTHIAFNITHTQGEKSTAEGHPPTHTDTHHLTLWNLIFRETGASGRDVPGRRTPAKARAEGALHLNHAPEEKSPGRESERPIFYKFLTG